MNFTIYQLAPNKTEKVQSSGDVWVLVIRKAKPTDSGLYVCEAGNNDTLRSFHKLIGEFIHKKQFPLYNCNTNYIQISVLPRGLVPPENNTEDTYSQSYNDPFAGRVHNYTDCCVNNNVSQTCLGFCNIQNILDGNTGQGPEYCEQDFPTIVRLLSFSINIRL